MAGIFLSVTACSPSVKEGALAKPYFDLKGYFLQEAERLSGESGFSKTVNLDGQVEQQTLDSLNWSTEFQAFADADINLPAWYDKYSIDSTFTENGLLSSLRYMVQDSSLNTKIIAINFIAGVPNLIEIERQSNSPLAQTYKKLEYKPATGYTILNKQRLRLAEEKEVLVTVSWE